MITKKRVLILASDAGFGHRKAAEAITAALEDSYGDRVEVTTENPLHDPAIPEIVKMVETSYDEVVVEDPTLYQLAYSASDAPMVAQLMQRVTTTVVNKTLTELVSVHLPDLIVVAYPAYIQAAIQACKNLGHEVPINVVVTDLINVHSMWFHQSVDLTFVPTGNVYRQALDSNLRKGSIQLTGLPVHPQFTSKDRSKAELREALGWEPDLPAALIVGSARTRQTANITSLLDNSGLSLQVAAVGGGDPDVEAQLRSIDWKGAIHVYGLVSNMPEMMRAADFIICKAGGLIVSEALACGLPLVLIDALPGQEVGNVRYVTENGAGAWSPGAIGALTTVYAWFANDGAGLERARAAARRIGKPNASHDVADWIVRQIKA